MYENMLNKKTKDILIECFEYVLVLLLVIECNTVYRHTLGRPIVPQIWNYLIITVFILIILKKKTFLNKYSDKIMISMLYCTLLMLFVQIPQSEFSIYIRLFLLFFPLSIILCFQNLEEGRKFNILYKFENVVLLLAITSLFFWITGSVLNIIAPNMELPVTWNNGDVYNGFYGLLFQYKTQYSMIPVLNVKILRNIGIFTESPMYNIVLIIALFTEFFLRNKYNKTKVYILSITILSTFGTLGIMLMLAGFLFKYLFNSNGKKCYGLYILTMVLFATMIAFLLINKIENGYGSFSVHLDDYKAGIKAWWTSPLTGTGFNNYEVIRQFMSPLRSGNQGTSNSFTDIMGQGGFALLIVYLTPLIMLLLTYKENKKILYWSLAPFALFIVTIYHYTFLLIFILAFCFANSCWVKESLNSSLSFEKDKLYK